MMDEISRVNVLQMGDLDVADISGSYGITGQAHLPAGIPGVQLY
jgi:hypothetical protein